MPNEPKHAKEKRTESGPRHNAQGNHEGSAHDASEFPVMSPQKRDRGKKKPGDPPADSEDDS